MVSVAKSFDAPIKRNYSFLNNNTVKSRSGSGYLLLGQIGYLLLGQSGYLLLGQDGDLKLLAIAKKILK